MKSILSVFVCLPVIAGAQDLSWPDPVANHVVPRQSTAVTHGPVLGDVTEDSVRIWLRAESELEFEVLVRRAAVVHTGLFVFIHINTQTSTPGEVDL